MSANDATAVIVYQLDEVACKYTFFRRLYLIKVWTVALYRHRTSKHAQLT